MRRSLSLLRAAAATAILAPLAAIPQQTTFKVTTDVQAYCLVSTSDLVFGNYAANTASDLQGNTEVRVTCSPNTQYKIQLNEGTSSGATVADRRMVNGSNLLRYQLYHNASRNPNQVWGKTTGTDTVEGNGNGTAQPYTVFGIVTKAQFVPPGRYEDTVTVTVLF